MLVSCIMPTYNRRHLIPLALDSYLAQDWPERELIVVDDGSDCVMDLFADLKQARYYHVPMGMALSEKVNYACELAQGEIIATWDDDDWSAPGRLTDQVTRLVQSKKGLTGYSCMLYWDGQRATRYTGDSDYATGLSQVYRTQYWNEHRFQPKNVGYDNDLSFTAAHEHASVVVPGIPPLMVGRIHRSNVSPKTSAGDSSNWPVVETSEIPAEFFTALGGR